jgi:FkbM family methyltransferase
MLFKPSVFFIQIGANDGLANDPLNKFVMRFNWNGILLEPLPEVFEALKSTYASKPHLQLLNAALGEKDGSQTIYTVRMDEGTFKKAHQFSSFKKEAVLSKTSWIPDVAQRIEERAVPCVTFDTLLRHAGQNEIDLLQIDAEGYDYTILKMIDFSRLKPAIINYECGQMNKAQREEIASLLISQGYRMSQGDLDSIAYRPPGSFDFH